MDRMPRAETGQKFWHVARRGADTLPRRLAESKIRPRVCSRKVWDSGGEIRQGHLV